MKKVTPHTKPEGMRPGKAPLPREPMAPDERERYKRGPYKRGPYKSPATQGRILGKALVGMSQRQIAESENVNRDTVRRILTQSEMRDAILEGRREFVALVPLALAVYKRNLEKGEGPQAVNVAKDVLAGGQISIPKSESVVETVEIESGRSMEDQFYRALHNHWPEEECHCNDPKAKPPKDGGGKV
jgi:hypothetical protein